MGREALCTCRCGAEAGEVKALLETDAVILRGAVKRRIPIASITDIRVDAESLHLAAGGEAVVLELGGAEAARWATKLATPAPSLRQKLGVGPDCLAFVVGEIGGTPLAEALAEALARMCAKVPSAARAMVAIVRDEAELSRALATHATMPAGAAIWVVYGKGRAARFGEGAVRAFMRGNRFIDTKVSGVSQELSATKGLCPPGPPDGVPPPALALHGGNLLYWSCRTVNLICCRGADADLGNK